MNRPVMKNIGFLIFVCTGILLRPCICLAQDAHSNTDEFDSTLLPPHFNVSVFDSSKEDGYYLFYAKTEETTNLLILDKYGNMVCFKPLPHNALFNMDEKTGRMLITTVHKDFVMDSAFHIIDTVEFKNYAIDNHDERLLDNGHVLLLGQESFPIDLEKYPEWKKWSHSDTLMVKGAIIQEQDSARNVVFEWHAKDHFDFDDVDTFFFNNGGHATWTHSNALEQDTDGNYLLSSRNFCEITKISRGDGRIIWRWGGHHNEFKLLNCTEPFYGQHNIRRIANGHYTLYDNGEYIKSHGARALEFELDQDKKVATLKWSYTYDVDMTSNGQGNVERLANGNTLINFGRISCDSVCFVVVDSAGSRIFQLNGLSTYRVVNLPSLPWQLRRPQVIRTDSAGITYLEAERGHPFYYWSNGSRERIIAVKNTDSYYVFVPYGDGAYVCSKKIQGIKRLNALTKTRKSVPAK